VTDAATAVFPEKTVSSTITKAFSAWIAPPLAGADSSDTKARRPVAKLLMNAEFVIKRLPPLLFKAPPKLGALELRRDISFANPPLIELLIASTSRRTRVPLW
jgi:hypothetical protein